MQRGRIAGVRAIAGALILALILIAGHGPGALAQPLPPLHTLQRDKVLHATVFFSAAAPAAFLWPDHWPQLTAGFVAAALLTEAAQHDIPGRVPDWHDVVANLIGTGAGIGLGLGARWLAPGW